MNWAVIQGVISIGCGIAIFLLGVIQLARGMSACLN